jgi:glucose/arabinose dehydrogenase
MTIRLATCAFAALVLLGGCSQSAPETASPATPEPTATRSPSPRPTGAPSPERPFDPQAVEVGARAVARGLEAPVGLANADDGSGRLYVVEQGGTIRYLENARGEPRPFLDISDRITAGGEQGLLGLAFHPRFEANGRFFVDYTDTQGDTVVAGYRASNGEADAASERVLLRVDQPFPNHNGGDLAFGPDGFLYISLGDGGSAGDPENNGQRLDTLLGKLLRIDVDAEDAGEYGIPRDNPFVGNAEARPEIWAYGLRNPWQFSFDRDNGALWIADVGQGDFEEVNRASSDAAGLNYGWRVLEGESCYEAPDCDAGDFKAPVATYSHEFGCSVTGGYVYRGERFPSLRGAYITGDYCSGNLWALPAEVNNASDPEPTAQTGFGITSFGEDEAGELYMTDVNTGTILQVTGRAR